LPLTAVPYAFRVNRVASAELDDVLELGDASTEGSLTIYRTGVGTKEITLNESAARISTYAGDGAELIRLYGPSWGELWLMDAVNHDRTVLLSSNNNSGGVLNLYDPDARLRATFNGSASGANCILYDGATSSSISLRGDLGGKIDVEGTLNVVDTIGGDTWASLGKNGSGGGVFRSYDELGNQTVIVGSSAGAGGGFMNVHMDASIWPGVSIDGDDGNSGSIEINKPNNVTTIRLDGNSMGNVGVISLYDETGDETVEIAAAEAAGQGAQIALRKADGTTTITLDADFNGDGRINTQELQITGGSDVSEHFEIASVADCKPEPGMVVCIHPEKVGELMVSTKAYDRTVAGVISGAGGVKPGMLMGQQGTKADGHSPVALTGRVYVQCDASTGAIGPGDLLTTSDVPGHAMRVTDHAKAQGAILGKAMSPLAEGRGLVLVLVSLQ
ncbi:MAG: hypothetical protein HY718_02315, partial [Planctomycetes bacterium]|nr:hypothetical protein [Planctomycetota bacterium]